MGNKKRAYLSSCRGVLSCDNCLSLYCTRRLYHTWIAPSRLSLLVSGNSWVETTWRRIGDESVITLKKMTEYQIIVKYSYYKLMSNIFLMAVGCLTVSKEFNLLCFNLFLKFQVCIYFTIRGSKKCYQKLLNFITEVYTLKTDTFFTSCPKRSNRGERREMENGKGKTYL